jgi:HNH/ENDO VII superfamily nuclease/pretoxin HINT domain-containing protein
MGEQVWAYNPSTKKMELEPIQHIWLNHDNDLVNLTLTATLKGSNGKTTQKEEVIHTNEKHPFLTQEKGFLPVSQIQPGMHIRQADGNYGMVAKLVVVPGAMWMYNLTVAQDHTYVVGLEQWVVHNCNRALLRSHTGAGAGEQAHHIIPCACEGDPNVVAATGMGFQIDSAANGIALTTDPAVAAARGEVSHSGSHSVYTAFIQSRLNFWGASSVSALTAVNNTISDSLDYMANLASRNPGIRLF